MGTFQFTVFEVESSYYNSGDGKVLASDTMTITDDDNTLQANPTTDPGSDQSLAFDNEPTVTSYDITYLDYAQVNGSGPEHELFAMRVNFSDGTTKDYVMSKSEDFEPGNGDDLNLSTYSSFVSTDYGMIGSAVCFTPGALILTPRGEVPVQTLRPGDLVQTMDNGVQPIVWVGQRTLSTRALARTPNLHPVLIRQGVFGNRRPLLVSPQHRMLIGTGADQSLIRAKHVAEHFGGAARFARGKREVTYVHLLFEGHQVIFAEGAATESLYPGPMAMEGISRAERSEISSLFPDLEMFGMAGYPLARPILPRHAVALLANRLARGSELGRSLCLASGRAGRLEQEDVILGRAA